MKVTVRTIDTGLGALLAHVQHPARALRAAANVVQSITQGCFNSVGAHMRPTPWKAKLDGSASILVKTGALKASIQVTSVTDREAVVSSDRPYAAIHQLGGKTAARKIVATQAGALSFYSPKLGRQIIVKSVQHPGSNIPARPFFPVDGSGNLTPAAAEGVRSAVEVVLKK